MKVRFVYSGSGFFAVYEKYKDVFFAFVDLELNILPPLNSSVWLSEENEMRMFTGFVKSLDKCIDGVENLKEDVWGKCDLSDKRELQDAKSMLSCSSRVKGVTLITHWEGENFYIVELDF